MKWPEESVTANLPNVCRLCMAEGTERMQKIFAECEHDGERFQLSSRIVAVTSLKVEPGDQLPEQACQHCVAQVNRWYDFKMLCESSDSMLRRQLVQSNSDIEIIMDLGVGALQPGLLFNGDPYAVNNQPVESITNGFSSPLPFLCTLCEARFSRKLQLKQHIAAHCGEPPHQCKRCDAGFTFKTELMEHIHVYHPLPRKVRRNNRPKYTCALCPSNFKTLQNLVLHQTAHTSAFRLRCIFCSRLCTNALQLYFHLYHHIKHGRTCSKCQRSFSSIRLFRQHLCNFVEIDSYLVQSSCVQ